MKIYKINKIKNKLYSKDKVHRNLQMSILSCTRILDVTA